MNTQSNLYPLKFQPSFHYRIWGGNQLKTKFNKSITEDLIGESWEISTVPNFVSIVNEGNLKGKNLNELIELFGADLLGKKVIEKYGKEFPLLIKFLDTQDVLSVQVHPDDQFAKKHHNSFGKNEMWYILDAQEDSEIIVGFKKNTTKEVYENSLKNNNLEDILRTVKPYKNEVFYLPAGRVHAVGKNISLLEIQQNSDVTYRIYDYNRIDKDGKLRELHTEKALQVSDFSYIENPSTNPKIELNKIIDLQKTPFFSTKRLSINTKNDLKFDKNSFTILTQTKGKSTLKTSSFETELNLGETVFLPAIFNEFSVENINNQENELILVRID